MFFQYKFWKYLNGFKAVLKLWFPKMMLACTTENELKTTQVPLLYIGFQVMEFY